MSHGTYRAQKLRRISERTEAAPRDSDPQPTVDYAMGQARALLRTRRGVTVTGPAYTRKTPVR